MPDTDEQALHVQHIPHPPHVDLYTQLQDIDCPVRTAIYKNQHVFPTQPMSMRVFGMGTPALQPNYQYNCISFFYAAKGTLVGH